MSNVLVEEQYLSDIANSIRSKNGSTDTYKPSEMSNAIDNISSGISKLAPEHISFYGCPSTVTELDLSWLDTSNMKNMRYMFYSAAGLLELDLSKFDFTNITSFYYMLQKCSALKKVIFPSNLKANNVTTMYGMFGYDYALEEVNLAESEFNENTSLNSLFYYCSTIEKIDLSNMKVPKVTDANSMFNLCSALKEINMRGVEMPLLTKVATMFSGCTNLEKLDISSLELSKLNWTSSSTTTKNCFHSVPSTCFIILKDSTEKEWFQSKFTAYTNVYTLDEYILEFEITEE